MKKTIKLPNAIWGYQLNSADLQVYVAVVGYANRFGHCYVKQDTLAAAVGASVPTVIRAIKRLASCALLTITKRYNREGQTIANGYTIAALPGGFTLVPADVLRYRLPKSAFKVYIYLLRCRSNECLEAVPSLSQMVSALHMSKRTIIDAINHLSGCLLLHKESYRHKQDGRIGHNRYRVITDAIRRVLLVLLAGYARAKEKRVTLRNRVTRAARNKRYLFKTRIAETLAFVKAFFARRAVLWRIFIGTILTVQERYSPKLRLQLKSNDMTVTKFTGSIDEVGHGR